MQPLLTMVSGGLERIFLFRSGCSKRFIKYCCQKAVAKKAALVSFEEVKTGLVEAAPAMPLLYHHLLNIFKNVWGNWNCFSMISRKKPRC